MKSNKWIRFLGGKSLIFTLLVLGMIAGVIFLYSKVAFIFEPFVVVFSTIIPPVIVGLILYYLINPLVKLLEKYVKRTWIIVIIYVIILALLIFGGIELIIAARNQAIDLVKHFPDILQSFEKNVDSVTSNFPYVNELKQLQDSLNLSSTKISKFIESYLQSGAKGFGGVFSIISTLLLAVITGPIIAFFLLQDKEKFFKTGKKLIPPVFRADFTEFAKIVDQQIGGYLKGQIAVSAILGIMYWPCFMVMGIKYAGTLALVAGILSIVPYIGSFAAFVPGLIIAFQSSFMMAVIFVIVWFVVQSLHGQFIVPKVMGNNLQLHPITVLLVLLVMGDMLGIIGVIFGIPIYCFIKAITIYLFRKFKKRYNRFYGEFGQYEDTKFSKEDYLDKK
ncbi:AI-2E family transporter [Liquorilactobacillus mali]|uniref:AI-2E family transporter n=1 Tax=Liquorilactobacillus mali TaxID=1618 RepID=UPI002954B0FE|nr:AI-2E family transporter [Liquorilactobacillus mali]MDV7758073.1 AI-2E family transporter [Liquorilactobacillus mali]